MIKVNLIKLDDQLGIGITYTKCKVYTYIDIYLITYVISISFNNISFKFSCNER